MTISENVVFVAKNLTGAAFQNMMQDAMKAEEVVGGSFEQIQSQAGKAGLAIGALGAVGMAFVASSTRLAARVETLGIVLYKVGQNAGYSTQELDAFEKSVRDAGITTQAARQSIVLMAQANLDLSKASELARIAQDAAVIAGVNSSQAFERMIHAVTTLQPEVLRTLGIIVNLDQAYSDYAEQMGVSAMEIDGQTKQQIMMNAVMTEASKIAGSYTGALDTAGKKVGSMDRLTEEASLTMGKIFLPAYNQAVDAVYNLLKAFNALDPALQTTMGEFFAFSSVMLVATGAILGLVAKLPGAIAALFTFGASAQTAALSLVSLPGPLGAVAAGIAGVESAALGGALALGVVAGAVAALGVVLFGLYKLHQIAKREQEEYRKSILDTADTLALVSDNYTDYVARTKEAMETDTLRIDKEGDLIAMVRTRYDLQKLVVVENALMERSEYGVIKALQAEEDEERELIYQRFRRMEATGSMATAEENLETALKQQTFAMAFARDASEELAIAQSLFPGQIKFSNAAMFEAERAALLLAAAQKDLTEEEQEYLELQIDGLDIKLGAIDTMAELKNETLEAEQAAKEALHSYDNFFGAINVSLPSPIKAFMDDLKWMIAGGAEYYAAFEEIKTLLFEQKITPEEALAFSEELFVAVEQGLAEAGFQEKDQAAENISEALGVPIDEAHTKLGEFETGLDAVAAVTRELTFEVVLIDPFGIVESGMTGGTVTFTAITEGGGQAMGGSYLVDRPTHFMAGEAGPEYAFFIPKMRIGELSAGAYGSPIQASTPFVEGGGGGRREGDTFIFHNYDEGSAALAHSLVANSRRKQLNASMGIGG